MIKHSSSYYDTMAVNSIPHIGMDGRDRPVNLKGNCPNRLRSIYVPTQLLPGDYANWGKILWATLVTKHPHWNTLVMMMWVHTKGHFILRLEGPSPVTRGAFIYIYSLTSLVRHSIIRYLESSFCHIKEGINAKIPFLHVMYI